MAGVIDTRPIFYQPTCVCLPLRLVLDVQSFSTSHSPPEGFGSAEAGLGIGAACKGGIGSRFISQPMRVGLVDKGHVSQPSGVQVLRPVARVSQRVPATLCSSCLSGILIDAPLCGFSSHSTPIPPPPPELLYLCLLAPFLPSPTCSFISGSAFQGTLRRHHMNIMESTSMDFFKPKNPPH